MSADQKAKMSSVRGGCNRAEVVNNVLNLQNVAGTSQEWNGTNETTNLRRESERLKTFDNWPVKFLESSKLASAGFYYLKRGDKVRCVFCGVELCDWRPGDDPMGDHARWSDTCPFVKKQPVGNIPLNVRLDNGNSGSDSGIFDYLFLSCMHLIL